MRRYVIKHPLTANPEVNAIHAFFVWQESVGLIDIARDDSILLITKGNRVPVLFYDGLPVAQGYFEIIDYWRNEGLCLC